MFALRASCSSIWTAATRRPSLVARLSHDVGKATFTQPPPNASETVNIADFLENEAEGSGPSPFDIQDGPPTPERGYSKRDFSRATLIPQGNQPKYRLHCHSSRNNTIVTFTRPNGNTVAWASGGRCKFKKGARASYEAGYNCAVTMFKAILAELGPYDKERSKPFQLELFFKGFGEGREAMKTALLGAEGTHIRPLVCRITDRTPLKIGGTRSKKTRRV